jgi:ferredoxin
MIAGAFVILTSKRGLFRTEVGAGIEPVETYDYLFCGQPRARFVIARLHGEPRITIIDEAPPPVVNVLPSKFLPKFGSLEAARSELEQLTRGTADPTTRLVRVSQDVATPAPAALPNKVVITFLTSGGKVVTAPPDSNLLRVSLREQGGIPFKCGGGLCGTCHCTIESGIENTDAVKPKERKLLSEAELAANHRLACQTFLKGDVSVSWVPLAQRAAAR